MVVVILKIRGERNIKPDSCRSVAIHPDVITQQVTFCPENVFPIDQDTHDESHIGSRRIVSPALDASCAHDVAIADNGFPR